MASKLIKVHETVYQELSKFRDDNNLVSFTQAIKTLLAFREASRQYQLTLLDENADIPGPEVSSQPIPVPQATKLIQEITCGS